MVSLSFRRLTKRFGAVTAVDQANLDVNGGEFLVIVGESGCGKTTTLRLIAGLEQPDSGTIFINGAPVNDVPVGQRGVQMIFQNFALWPHMKVFDEQRYSNLSLPLQSEKMVQRQDHRVSPPARLENRHRRKFLQTQTHRAFGRSATARRPRPRHGHFAARVVDGRAAEQYRSAQSLKDAPGDPEPSTSENRLTTLYVTHNLADGIALADRIAVMHDGQI